MGKLIPGSAFTFTMFFIKDSLLSSTLKTEKVSILTMYRPYGVLCHLKYKVTLSIYGYSIYEQKKCFTFLLPNKKSFTLEIIFS